MFVANFCKSTMPHILRERLAGQTADLIGSFGAIVRGCSGHRGRTYSALDDGVLAQLRI